MQYNVSPDSPYTHKPQTPNTSSCTKRKDATTQHLIHDSKLQYMKHILSCCRHVWHKLQAQKLFCPCANPNLHCVACSGEVRCSSIKFDPITLEPYRP